MSRNPYLLSLVVPLLAATARADNEAPNETWKIDVAYSITYPKEGSVAGLP